MPSCCDFPHAICSSFWAFRLEYSINSEFNFCPHLKLVKPFPLLPPVIPGNRGQAPTPRPPSLCVSLLCLILPLPLLLPLFLLHALSLAQDRDLSPARKIRKCFL